MKGMEEELMSRKPLWGIAQQNKGSTIEERKVENRKWDRERWKENLTAYHWSGAADYTAEKATPDHFIFIFPLWAETLRKWTKRLAHINNVQQPVVLLI